jgi:hypothetical protein
LYKLHWIDFSEVNMENPKPNRVMCPLCGKDFATRADQEEHKRIVHNTMDKKTNLGGHRTDPRDFEPADDTPTTELPPGAESAVNQGSGARSSARAPKSKGAGK